MTPRLHVFAVAWLALLGAPALAQPASQPSLETELRRGAYQTTFAEQDARSPIEAQTRRNHVRNELMQRYTLSEETFEVYVPEDYDPANTYGIMVWTSAGNRGTMPRGWREVMDKHRLIYVGANNAGNDRGVAVRFALAMDGVINLKRRYRIDESRIYASGNSGGGKVSSMLAVIYPETFCGAIPIVGSSYYRGIPLNDGTRRQYEPNFAAPPAAILDRAKEFSRIVLITGSRDSNRDPMKNTYELGYLPDGFKLVEYVEVEGMGHTMPPVEYVDRAIESLDKPLESLAQRMLDLGQQLQKAGKPLEARPLYQGVYLHGDSRLAAKAAELLDRIDQTMAPASARRGTARAAATPATLPATPASRETEAAGILSLADNYERNLLYPQARQRAERVVREFPETKAAAKAKEMIKRLDARR